jgi:hypothetical protein
MKMGRRESSVTDEIGERERSLKSMQRFKGLSTPGLTPGRTLFGLIEHCPAQLDFV